MVTHFISLLARQQTFALHNRFSLYPEATERLALIRMHHFALGPNTLISHAHGYQYRGILLPRLEVGFTRQSAPARGNQSLNGWRT
jgi:hypothetical protein